MKPDDRSWQKLVAAARRAAPPGDESAPFGFSTRVAALAFGNRRSPVSEFARLSLRAAAVAGLLAVLAVAANFSAIRGAFDDENAVATTSDDPIAEVVDMGS
jgi:hypothetical protein